MTAPVIPGAEAWSADGGPHGALVLHGFTGNPTSVRGLGEALAAAGFAVELPRLPGHGTVMEEMLDTSWDDWSGEAEAALGRLRARLPEEGRVVVVGLSMGGALTIWLATRHADLAGIATINPVAQPAEVLLPVIDEAVAAGEEVLPGIGSDIAKPGVAESAYPGTPLRPLRSFIEGVVGFQEGMAKIDCPLLVLTAPNDHVVVPTNSDHLAASVAGPVQRVTLERSYHVATLDYDKELIEERAVEFARKVTG